MSRIAAGAASSLLALAAAATTARAAARLSPRLRRSPLPATHDDASDHDASAPTTSTSSTTDHQHVRRRTSSTTTTVAPPPCPNPEALRPTRAPQRQLTQVGTIEIPKIGVSKAMYEGITLTTLDHGPGHWPGTAMPGQIGNVVIAGHRVSHDKPFRNIDKLAAGDEVILTTARRPLRYKVTGTEVVYPDALWIVDQTPDYTATLFACHPPGSTRQRIVVHLALDPTRNRLLTTPAAMVAR